MNIWQSKIYARRFILPAVIALAIIVIVPMIFLWYVSVTDYTLGKAWEQKQFVGIKNFAWLFSGQDTDFWPAIRISLVFMISAVVLQFMLGLGIALLFNREIKGKKLWMSLLMIPLTITPSVIGLMWKLMYNTEYGVLNFILKSFGLKIDWLSAGNALKSVVLIDIWQWTPFVALILYAGLQALPQEPYEAALVDGASGVQIFRFITLPLLRPIVLIAVLLRTIDSLKIFDTVYVLTRGGPGNVTELLSLHIYRLGFQHMGWIGRASAVSIILLVMSTAICTIFIRIMRRENA